MRISDERYRRDLRRLQVAWRMVQLGARTPTIKRWTALSKYNIRKLRNEYGGDAVPREGLQGKTPFRLEFFCKSAKLRCEAPLLAGFLRAFGALPAPGEMKVEELPELARGERLCAAYEQFLLLCPSTEIDFDRVIILTKGLMTEELIRLTHCTTCGELVVHDCLVAREPSCAYCLHEVHAGLPHFQARRAPAPKQSETEAHEDIQPSLF